MIAIQ